MLVADHDPGSVAPLDLEFVRIVLLFNIFKFSESLHLSRCKVVLLGRATYREHFFFVEFEYPPTLQPPLELGLHGIAESLKVITRYHTELVLFDVSKAPVAFGADWVQVRALGVQSFFLERAGVCRRVGVIRLHFVPPPLSVTFLTLNFARLQLWG